MNINGLVRNPEAVRKTLLVTPDKQLITKTGCKMYVPYRFVEQGLAVIGSETRSVGIFAMVLETGEYAISLTNAMMPLTPTSTSQVVIRDEDYLEFHFEPGAVVCSNLMLIKSDVLVYMIYKELTAKGNLPWFVNYQDDDRLYDTAAYHGGIHLAASHSIMSMLGAVTARDPNNRSKYYRHCVREFNDIFTNPPDQIAFDNIQFGATNTTAKLIGSYFDDSTTAALVTPSERVEPIEAMLRA